MHGSYYQQERLRLCLQNQLLTLARPSHQRSLPSPAREWWSLGCLENHELSPSPWGTSVLHMHGGYMYAGTIVPWSQPTPLFCTLLRLKVGRVVLQTQKVVCTRTVSIVTKASVKPWLCSPNSNTVITLWQPDGSHAHMHRVMPIGPIQLDLLFQHWWWRRCLQWPPDVRCTRL